VPWETIREGILDGLSERGFTDLNASHLSVMLYPGPQGRRPSEVAAQRNMSKQAVNYILGQLEEMGYLIRLDDTDDQRFKRIALTERGRDAGLAMREVVREIEVDWESRLGPDRYAELRTLLADLNAIVERPG
jgi:DNA-binding MarR family transcriptional regulator